MLTYERICWIAEDGKSSGKLIVDDGESIMDFDANEYYELDIDFSMNAMHSKLELSLVRKKASFLRVV
ncbi:unnamed protein product [Anisakis simplex]|uniref:Cold-shock protein n=1 Tax=Anisakis simplex TaxID=6269 RepID=A0A0M3JET2_ANISI|nr:unnamed protein product [Anisakis simplex]